MSAVHGLFC